MSSSSQSIQSTTQHICQNFSPMLEKVQIDKNMFRLCLSEALTNAVIHGNFEIASILKEDDPDVFDLAVKERDANPHYRSKKIKIHCRFNQEQMMIDIEDEGQGFDTANLPDLTDPTNLRVYGRGLIFIRYYMDEVKWNEIGNQITMTKYVK